MSKKTKRNKKKKVQLKVNERVVMGTVSSNATAPLVGTAFYKSSMNATTSPSRWTDSPVRKVNVVYNARKIDWFKVLMVTIVVIDVLMLLWYALK